MLGTWGLNKYLSNGIFLGPYVVKDKNPLITEVILSFCCNMKSFLRLERNKADKKDGYPSFAMFLVEQDVFLYLESTECISLFCNEQYES